MARYKSEEAKKNNNEYIKKWEKENISKLQIRMHKDDMDTFKKMAEEDGYTAAGLLKKWAMEYIENKKAIQQIAK